jgi:hypothetical protein
MEPGEYLVCRCGLAVPVERFAENGYQCEQCRLAEILVKEDMAPPDRVSMWMPKPVDGVFS